MIYECPNCHAPQAAGHTACLQCGAEFDGPVPDDAIVPDTPLPSAVSAEAAPATAAPPLAADAPDTHGEPAEAAPVLGAESEALPEDPPLAAPTPPAPVLEEVKLEEVKLEEVRPPAEDLPYRSGPYTAPPVYTPPPAYAPPPVPSAGARAYTTRRSSASTLPKVLMIAAPIVLVLVVGGLLYSRSLDGGSDAGPAPRPIAAPVVPIRPLRPAAAPIGSPTVMPGGMTAGGAPEDPHVKWLAGRWQSKTSDFYVFNDNGSGSQGSLTGKLPTQDFLWRLVQNQLLLYGSPKDQQLRFSVGPDDDTVYLRDGSGRPAQFTRVKS